MKALSTVLLVLGMVSAWAQDVQIQGLDGAQERARIARQRQAQTAELDAQERACANRFAVADCVNQVSARRRAMLSEFKRQEASLDDAERRQRGAEQLQRSEEKAQERATRDAERQVSGSSEAERRRLQQDKQIQHAQPPMAGASANRAVKAPLQDAQAQQASRTDYARKQEAAAERRRARDKRLQERGAAPVPLPTPPKWGPL